MYERSSMSGLEVCGNDNCYSHSLPLPFPSPAITTFRIFERGEMCIHSVMQCIQNKNYQVGKLHRKHYKWTFLIIVIYHYSSLVSQLSVNYVRCSINLSLHVAMQNRTFLHMCHSHSHLTRKLLSFQWDSRGNPILTYSPDPPLLDQLFLLSVVIVCRVLRDYCQVFCWLIKTCDSMMRYDALQQRSCSMALSRTSYYCARCRCNLAMHWRTWRRLPWRRGCGCWCSIFDFIMSHLW